MNADQKKRAVELLARWRATMYGLHADAMAALLQELIDADDKFKARVVAAMKKAEPAARSVIVDGQPVFFSREGDDITDTHTLTPCLHCGGSGAADDCAPPPESNVPDGWRPFLTDVITAAGLLEHGKRDKGLAGRIGKFAFDAMRGSTPTPAEAPADVARDAERFVALINEAVANAASPIVDAMTEYEDVHGAGNTTLDGFRKAIDAAIERDKLKGGE